MKNIKFTSLNLHHLIEYEIKPMLPFYINKAKITEPGLISLRTSKGSTIHISTSISHPFVFVSDKRYKRTEHNFNAPLSSLVRNKKITEVKQFAMDRIFTIETSADVRIIVEMIPGRFNFLITDKSNEIINLYSYKKNREGEVILKPGAVYDFPDKQEMRQYLTTRTRRITDKEDMDIDELLKRRDFFLYRRDNSYNLFPFIDPNDEPIDRSASVSSLIETVLERESRLKKESVISGAVAGQEEKIDNLNKQIEKLRESRISKEEIEKIQEKAETLKAHLHEIKGKSTVTFPSVYDSDRELEIELDPALGPVENMENLFDKASAFTERNERYAKNILKLKREIKKIKANIESIEKGETSPGPEETKQQKQTGRIFTSPNGFKIIVGRNARENDHITMNIAKKDDIFLHARQQHGAHVVIKRAGRDIPREDIVYAAGIAAYYSRGRHSGLVDVQYTEARYVVKPKGSPLGAVNLLRENVLLVKPHR